MLTRRSFLSASATLALGQLLLGCNPNAQQSPRVRILRGSVPAQILQAFQRQGKDWKFAQSSQLDELFKLLETWKTQQNSQPSSGFRLPFTQAPSAPIDDLITLGDFWLAAAIQQNLIQPLPLADLAEWQQIPPQWQALVKRDRQGFPSPEGEIWAAPYRWGTLMIAYRPDKFSELGWVPQQWSDLWRPELKGHLSLPDSPREVIGLTLKKLGQSANAPDLLAIGVLTEELNRLHQQVKFYSSTHYLQPLLLEDTWAAVGWSPEILATLDREPELTAAIPTEGTL
nr:extracellular solute-binding protein [Oculatellaceae cyanobacterium Prado106]